MTNRGRQIQILIIFALVGALLLVSLAMRREAREVSSEREQYGGETVEPRTPEREQGGEETAESRTPEREQSSDGEAGKSKTPEPEEGSDEGAANVNVAEGRARTPVEQAGLEPATRQAVPGPEERGEAPLGTTEEAETAIEQARQGQSRPPDKDQVKLRGSSAGIETTIVGRW